MALSQADPSPRGTPRKTSAFHTRIALMFEWPGAAAAYRIYRWPFPPPVQVLSFCCRWFPERLDSRRN